METKRSPLGNRSRCWWFVVAFVALFWAWAPRVATAQVCCFVNPVGESLTCGPDTCAVYEPDDVREIPGVTGCANVDCGVVYVDDSSPNDGPGHAWTHAFHDLQDALALANDANNRIAEIRVAQGTYRPDSLGDRSATFTVSGSIALEGGYAGHGAADPDERDVALYETILSGDIGTAGDSSDNSYHVVVTQGAPSIDGFTITAGNAEGAFPSNSGGGMYNANSSPIVTNCTFIANMADHGAGMFNRQSSPTVTNCFFVGNTTVFNGAGLENYDQSHPTVTNCTFSGNSAGQDGGGMYNANTSSPTVTNCTFSGNSAGQDGGGMFNYNTSSPTVTNCILWGDTATNGSEIYNSSSTPTVTYSVVQGGYGGEGNFDADPLFVDADGLDDTLGTADDNLRLGLDSPCIDAGNDGDVTATTDMDGNPRIVDGDGDGTDTVDLGAYEVMRVYVDASATGIGDGSRWCDAFVSVQDALSVVTAGVILVADGTYKPTAGTDRAVSFVLTSGVTLRGGYAGCGAADPDERDVALYETILSGDIGTAGDSSDNSYHVVVTQGAPSIDGFTITGGKANGAIPNYKGGGMYNYQSSPTVTNCTFSGNVASNNGGGMYNELSSPTVTNCTFSGNSSEYGGGMYNYTASSPMVTNCTFRGNTAGTSGGGMDNEYYSSPTVINCTFSGNSASGGGGMRNWYTSNSTVTNCTFSGNVAWSTGGGMYNLWSSPTVTNCIFWGDSLNEIGNHQGSTPAVTYSTVQGGYTGTGNSDADPLFVDADGLDDTFGTADDNLRLSSGSPCIDAGSDAAVTATTDMDGNPRKMDGNGDGADTVDMGAYEMQLFVPDALDPCPNDFAEATGGAGGERLSRFGCVSAPEPPAVAGGGATAMRVVFRTLYNTTPGDPDGASVCADRSLLASPLPSLSQFQGQTRWLGPPVEIVDEAVPTPLNYIGAPLVCTAGEAAVRSWSPAGLAAEFGGDADATRIYFYDYALVPCSVYEVSRCSDPLNESTCSPPVLIFTSRMADAWPPFDAAGQPSFTDINALVNKFKGIPFAPGATPQGGAPEWHSLQKGNVVGDYDVTVANRKVGFLDIGISVDGFKGLPYREQGPCIPNDVHPYARAAPAGFDNCGNPCDPDPQ